MKLKIVPVTNANYEVCLSLKVAQGQENYIETPQECLNEAAEFALWRPVLIYADECPVGFAMYGLWESEGENGRVWLDRLLIDGRYQGLGYGRQALAALVLRLQKEYGKNQIFLSLYEDNKRAAELYLHFGFRYNGELDINGEKVMVYGE